LQSYDATIPGKPRLFVCLEMITVANTHDLFEKMRKRNMKNSKTMRVLMLDVEKKGLLFYLMYDVRR